MRKDFLKAILFITFFWYHSFFTFSKSFSLRRRVINSSYAASMTGVSYL
jgi:hypothetical protein